MMWALGAVYWPHVSIEHMGLSEVCHGHHIVFERVHIQKYGPEFNLLSPILFMSLAARISLQVSLKESPRGLHEASRIEGYSYIP